MLKLSESNNDNIVRLTITKNSIRTTVEIFPASDFIKTLAAANHYRVKIDRAWYPDADTCLSAQELLKEISDRLGLNDKLISIEDDIRVHFATPNDEMWHPQVYGNSNSQSPVDLDTKYQDEIKSVNRQRYSGDEIDRFFAEKYGTDIHKKQIEREWFDSLPLSERYAWLDKMMGKTMATTDNMVSGLEKSEAERVNSMSPSELKAYMAQAQKDGRERLKTDKTAKASEKEINSGDDVDDLPQEWNNQF